VPLGCLQTNSACLIVLMVLPLVSACSGHRCHCCCLEPLGSAIDKDAVLRMPACCRVACSCLSGLYIYAYMPSSLRILGACLPWVCSAAFYRLGADYRHCHFWMFCCHLRFYIAFWIRFLLYTAAVLLLPFSCLTCLPATVLDAVMGGTDSLLLLWVCACSLIWVRF